MTQSLIGILDYAICCFDNEANAKRSEAYTAIKNVVLESGSIYEAREKLEYGAMFTPDETRRDVFNHVLHIMDILRDI